MNYNKKILTALIKAIVPTVLFLFLSTGFALSQEQSKLVIDSSNKRKFDYYFYDALNAKAKGNFAEAFDLFQHCHTLDSTNANVLSELGSFFNVLQEKSKAVEYLSKAVKLDPNNYYYNMVLASLYKEVDQKEEAIDIYNMLLKTNPQKTDLYMALAEVYNDNGDLDKAIEALDELEKNVGIRESITLNKFRLYSMLSKKDEAFDEIKSIIKKNPDNLNYIILLGDVYMQDNQLDKSLEQYEKVKAIDPDLPALVISMVNYYEKSGKSELAKEEIRTALLSSMFDVDMKLQLLTRYITMLQSNKADTKIANPLFISLFDQHPHHPQLNFLYGSVLLLQENKDEAMKQFEIYTEAEPDNPAGWEQMLRIALPDSLDQVVTITENALKHIPDAYQFYFYLGGAKYQQKKYQEALDIFESGLETMDEGNSPVKSDFYAQIGDLNYHLGNHAVAFENYEKALKINPQNLGVLNNYSYFLSVQNKDLDKAERMSEITVKAEPTNATFLDTYGWVLFKQGAYTMAKIYIENAVKYSEDEPSSEVLEHYGDVLYKTDEPEQALEQWKKAKEIGSESKTLNKKIKSKKYIDEN